MRTYKKFKLFRNAFGALGLLCGAASLFLLATERWKRTSVSLIAPNAVFAVLWIGFNEAYQRRKPPFT